MKCIMSDAVTLLNVLILYDMIPPQQILQSKLLDAYQNIEQLKLQMNNNNNYISYINILKD